MNAADEPKIALQTYYKHLDEIERLTDSQARYVARAISSACCLFYGCSTGDARAAVFNAASCLIQQVWRHRVCKGLVDGEQFNQFWDLVIHEYRPNVDFIRVCRSQVRERAVTIEIQPRNGQDKIAFTVDP